MQQFFYLKHLAAKCWKLLRRLKEHLNHNFKEQGGYLNVKLLHCKLLFIYLTVK